MYDAAASEVVIIRLSPSSEQAVLPSLLPCAALSQASLVKMSLPSLLGILATLVVGIYSVPLGDDVATTSTATAATSPPSLSLRITDDGRCGHGQTCAGSEWGQCCSEYGYCGSNDKYCGAGCKAAFGICSEDALAGSANVGPDASGCPAVASTTRTFNLILSSTTWFTATNSYLVIETSTAVKTRTVLATSIHVSELQTTVTSEVLTTRTLETLVTSTQIAEVQTTVTSEVLTTRTLEALATSTSELVMTRTSEIDWTQTSEVIATRTSEVLVSRTVIVPVTSTAILNSTNEVFTTKEVLATQFFNTTAYFNLTETETRMLILTKVETTTVSLSVTSTILTTRTSHAVVYETETMTRIIVVASTSIAVQTSTSTQIVQETSTFATTIATIAVTCAP